jgi:hypothetical protein
VSSVAYVGEITVQMVKCAKANIILNSSQIWERNCELRYVLQDGNTCVIVIVFVLYSNNIFK